jgi:hypothetical protein
MALLLYFFEFTKFIIIKEFFTSIKVLQFEKLVRLFYAIH